MKICKSLRDILRDYCAIIFFVQKESWIFWVVQKELPSFICKGLKK